MKFGKYLEANRDPEWAEYYINYNELKGHIDAIQDNLPNAEAQFGIKLEENWRTYKNFTDTWSQNLLQTKTTKQSVIPIVQMNAFMYINQESLRKIIKKHDKNSDVKLAGSWEWKINDKPFLQLISIIAQVSKLHEETRCSNYDQPASPLRNPKDLTPVKHKHQVFWVPQERMMPLVCLIIQHLPMLTFTGKQGNEKLSEKMRTIYLDNTDLDIYHSIVNQPADADTLQLQFTETDPDMVFIVRKHGREGFHSDICTQGGNMIALSNPSTPNPGSGGNKSPSFSDTDAAESPSAPAPFGRNERSSSSEGTDEIDKIHGRRCCLPSKYVSKFLHDGSIPDDADINPRSRKLLESIGETIVAKNLVTMLSTESHIVQFEIAGSSSFRCALEMDISMIRETFNTGSGSSKVGDKWITKTSEVKERDLYKFPHAVLNVYSQGHYADTEPEWFTKLITQTDLVQPQKNFSKYAHGEVTFYSKHCKSVPHWVENNLGMFAKDIDLCSSVRNPSMPTPPPKGVSAPSAAPAAAGSGTAAEAAEEDSDDDDLFDPDNDVKVHRMTGRGSIRDNMMPVSPGGEVHLSSKSSAPKPACSINGDKPARTGRGSVTNKGTRGKHSSSESNGNGGLANIMHACGCGFLSCSSCLQSDDNVSYSEAMSSSSLEEQFALLLQHQSQQLQQTTKNQNDMLLALWILVALFCGFGGIYVTSWDGTYDGYNAMSIGELLIIIAVVLILRAVVSHNLKVTSSSGSGFLAALFDSSLGLYCACAAMAAALISHIVMFR